MTVKKRKSKRSSKRQTERYYGKHSRYEFPLYQPSAFTSPEQAAKSYSSLADFHRLYAAGYIEAAAKREREKGKGDRLAKKWRAQAKKDYEIAQRADNEALKLG